MKSTKLNLLGGLLCAAILSFGLVLTSCEDGLLDNGEDTEQGENGNGVTMKEIRVTIMEEQERQMMSLLMHLVV